MDAAQQNVQFFERWSKVMADLLLAFTNAFSEYNAAKEGQKAQQEMANHIKNKGIIVPYAMTGGVKGEMMDALRKEGIPFIPTMNGEVIAIRDCDLERVLEINRDLNIAKCNYFQEVESEKMEDVIAKSDRVPTKDIITIEGLDKYEYEVLKNKCNDITSGFMVGKGQNGQDPEKIDLSVRADMVSSDRKMDFCRAFLAANMSLYGMNGEIKRAQIEEDEKVDKAVDDFIANKETAYIVSANSNKSRQYISINENGFQYHTSFKKDGEWHDETSKEISINDPNYRLELQRYMDKIYDKAIITSHEKLDEYVRTGDVETNRPRKSQQQYTIASAEKDMAKKIDQMIDERIEKQGLKEALGLDNEKLFNYYRSEARDILDALSKNKTLDRYDAKDFEDIQMLARTAGIDIVRYKNVGEHMKNKATNMHKAEPQKKRAKTKEKDEKAHERDAR